MEERPIVVGGAGPAGLTAAFELLMRGQGPVLILEADAQVGGLSKTVNYKGNRIDIGGHRFFSKSDWVMNWWKARMPIAAGQAVSNGLRISYQNSSRPLDVGLTVSPETEDALLVRNRLSRIFSHGKFFDYPLKASFTTARQLGLGQCMRFGCGYTWARLFPRRPEVSLEDFFVNRFGHALYEEFFKDYSEKVWGVSCRDISAEWGAQRIKGLSLIHALQQAVSDLFKLGRKSAHTSLIERFLYPRYGPGQMWERAAQEVQALGGRLLLRQAVVSTRLHEGRIDEVVVRDLDTNKDRVLHCRHFISTLPVSHLVGGMRGNVPARVASIARDLHYRDFLTVGLLLRKMKPRRDGRSGSGNRVPDNWIYIQEKNVKIGRLQIFNNWSPSMVADPGTVWLGLEYFCQENDDLWSLGDAELVELGTYELEKIGLIERADVLDGMALRVPKAYPGYYGAYSNFSEVREFLDHIPNLFLIGRNGMHRYNNQDHSMLTARLAAEAIAQGSPDKRAIWDVNVDDEYHEEGEMSLDTPPDWGREPTHPLPT